MKHSFQPYIMITLLMVGCAANPGAVAQKPAVEETSKSGSDEVTILLPPFGTTAALDSHDELPSHDGLNDVLNTKQSNGSECATYWRVYNSDNQLQAQAQMNMFGTTELKIVPAQLTGDLFALRLEEVNCSGLKIKMEQRKVLAVMTMRDETIVKEGLSFLWPLKRTTSNLIDLQNIAILNGLDAAANNMIVLFQAKEDVLQNVFTSAENTTDKSSVMLRAILAQNYLYDDDSEQDDFVGSLVGFYTTDGHPLESKPFELLVNNQSVDNSGASAAGILFGQIVVKSIPIIKVLFCGDKASGQKTLDVSYVSKDGKLASIDDQLTVYYDYTQVVSCDVLPGLGSSGGTAITGGGSLTSAHLHDKGVGH